uniref:F-box domain-containing protein n=1 Tax=Glossina brevipalpis TaxID=37001 RepID=A0A1A9WHH1_9MUSC
MFDNGSKCYVHYFQHYCRFLKFLQNYTSSSFVTELFLFGSPSFNTSSSIKIEFSVVIMGFILPVGEDVCSKVGKHFHGKLRFLIVQHTDGYDAITTTSPTPSPPPPPPPPTRGRCGESKIINSIYAKQNAFDSSPHDIDNHKYPLMCCTIANKYLTKLNTRLIGLMLFTILLCIYSIVYAASSMLCINYQAILLPIAHLMSSSKSAVNLVAPAATTLLDLNDDCLLNIFRYLSIQDAFNVLGCFNTRIDNVSLIRIADLKNLCFSLREPPTFKRWQLKIIGQNLESLCISAGYTLSSQMALYYLQLLLCSSESRTRLRKLTIHYVKFNNDYLDCVLNVISNIKYLDLSFCQLNDELLLPILERSRKLQTLKLIANYNLECKSLHYIQSPYLNLIELEMNLRCVNEVNKFITEHTNVNVIVHSPSRLSYIKYGPSTNENAGDHETIAFDLLDFCTYYLAFITLESFQNVNLITVHRYNESYSVHLTNKNNLNRNSECFIKETRAKLAWKKNSRISFFKYLASRLCSANWRLEGESMADVCVGEEPPEDGNHSSSVLMSSVCDGARESKLSSVVDALETGAVDTDVCRETGEAKLCGGELGGVNCVKTDTSDVLLGSANEKLGNWYFRFATTTNFFLMPSAILFSRTLRRIDLRNIASKHFECIE